MIASLVDRAMVTSRTNRRDAEDAEVARRVVLMCYGLVRMVVIIEQRTRSVVKLSSLSIDLSRPASVDTFPHRSSTKESPLQ